MLILEDYHLAECPPVAESVAFFIEHRPADVQVVLSVRSDPELPLGRLRANGQLAEIRADYLRFGDGEVADFFGRAGIDDLSVAELDQLTVRTEGWPAVLRLAAILLGSPKDRHQLVQAFTAQLYVSYNTIKTQARTAYRKLGAETRSQAVRRAQDLGVL